MKRRLFNMAAVVSMVLCLGTVGLWARSYWVLDRIDCGKTVNDRDINRLAIAAKGRVWFSLWSGPIPSAPHGMYYTRSIPGSHEDWQWGLKRVSQADEHRTGFLGFEFALEGDYPTNYQRDLVVPYWSLFTTALLMLTITRRFTPRRVSRNVIVCSSCRYSLTGNTSGVCPECGTPVAEKLEAKW